MSREDLPLSDLRPHPRNYQQHPEDQLQHLEASIRQFGFFRNVVIARDGTILAGHGAVEAARRAGLETVPVHRLDLDPDSPEALKVLAVDNEVGRFAERDDRALTDLLRELTEADPLSGLLGTGYDEMNLANLLAVTRHDSEIADFDAAAEWVGMPDYEPEGTAWRITVTFDNEDDRGTFIEQYGLTDLIFLSRSRGRRVISAQWPVVETARHDGGLIWEETAEES